MAEEATGPSVSLRGTMPEWSEVERTAEDAGLSKLQAAEQGHLSEETLQLQRALVRPNPRLGKLEPALARGTATRTLCTQRCATRFAQRYSQAQLLNLGCGLDSLSLLCLPFFARCVDVDFPAVASERADRLCSSSAASASLSGAPDYASNANVLWRDEHSRYTLLSNDLSSERSLSEELLPELDTSLPTLVVLECVLVYMDNERADSLLCWLSRTLKHSESAVLLYDMVLSSLGDNSERYLDRGRDQFGVTMEANLQRRGLTLHALKSIQEHTQRMERCGWCAAKSVDMLTAYKHLLTSEERKRSEKAEPLDEQEEFNLLMQHYCLVVASYNQVVVAEEMLACFR
jgi:O-methyltransferase involved in polyketide biosynthesis